MGDGLGTLGWLGIGGGLLSSILGGIFGSGGGPGDKASEYAMQELMAKIDAGTFGKTLFSQNELDTRINAQKNIARGSADVAAGRIGSLLAEKFGATGTPEGQPRASMFVSELAPVIAQGERDAIGIDQFGMNIAENQFQNAQSLQLKALLGALQGSQVLPAMSDTQRGIASGLQMMNLLASAFGNVAKGYKDFNN